MERTKEKFRALGKSVEKMNDLAQVNANLDLNKKLQRDDAPTLKDEAATVSGWRKEFVGGNEEYNSLFAKIQRGLLVSPFTYDDASIFDANPFETQAAEVGVHFPSWSNWGPSGMFLLDPCNAPDVGTEFVGELDGTEGYGIDGGDDARLALMSIMVRLTLKKTKTKSRKASVMMEATETLLPNRSPLNVSLLPRSFPGLVPFWCIA